MIGGGERIAQRFLPGSQIVQPEQGAPLGPERGVPRSPCLSRMLLGGDGTDPFRVHPGEFAGGAGEVEP